MQELPSISPDSYRNKYLYPTPTHEQNLDWHMRIHAGDEADAQSATREMWEANLNLVDFFTNPHYPPFGKGGRPVRKVVQNLRNYVAEGLALHPAIEYKDVLQWGRIGLGQAIGRWNPERGKLSLVVYHAVRTNVQHGFMNEGRTIRIPSSGSNDRRLPHYFCEAFVHSLEGGYSEQIELLKDHPDYWQMETEQLMLECDLDSSGIDYSEASSLTLASGVAEPSWSDDLGLSYNFSPDYLEWLMGKLSDREKYVVQQLHLREDRRSLDSIGAELDLTRERIRQISERALGRMRNRAGIVEVQDTNNNGTEKKQPKSTSIPINSDPAIAVDAQKLLPPILPLPELPKFSLNEKNLGMSHHEWLNRALQNIYARWYEGRTRGEAVRFSHITAQLGNKTILGYLSSKSELIENIKGHNGETTVELGCLTVDGAQIIIDAYRVSQYSTVTLRRYRERQLEQTLENI